MIPKIEFDPKAFYEYQAISSGHKKETQEINSWLEHLMKKNFIKQNTFKATDGTKMTVYEINTEHDFAGAGLPVRIYDTVAERYFSDVYTPYAIIITALADKKRLRKFRIGLIKASLDSRLITFAGKIADYPISFYLRKFLNPENKKISI